MTSGKYVHCELSGKVSSLEETRIVTKINGIINLKLLRNCEVDAEEKIIYSQGKPPIKFFEKLHVPADLRAIFGDLYSIVDDEDETEQSTHILSSGGMDRMMGSQLMQLGSYLQQYEVISFPDDMFFTSVSNIGSLRLANNTCDIWQIPYKGFSKKYMVKKVLDTRIEPQIFGVPGILSPGYDVAVSDCAAKNPRGTGYLFKTDRNFAAMNFCCNESAVDYCSVKDALVYYTDFINDGKFRILSKYTPSINTNLKNDYKFRSSNL